MFTRLAIWMVALLVAVPLALAPAFAQDGKLKKEELDQLLAPIALYPDDLLTNVLVASTYPLDVVEAARWRKESANAKLKGDALAKALEAKDWDPSIKALTQFPKVLQQMSDKLDWTQKLGDAFLAQQDEVMGEIQILRAKADEAGNLKSNKQQMVSKSSGPSNEQVIVIESASPETVYVPVYEPAVVYGSWWYPDYPPYYWRYPGAAFVNGFFWGAGVAIANDIWGWGHWDWNRHDIDIDVNKWNNINVNRTRITDGKWEHRPDHRGPVPYRDKATREKFGKDVRPSEAGKEFRGRDKDAMDRDKIQAKLKDNTGDRARDIKSKKGDGNVADRAKRPSDKAARPAAKGPSPAAFDVKRGADVRKHADRGQVSRNKAISAGHVSRAPARGGGRGGGRRR